MSTDPEVINALRGTLAHAEDANARIQALTALVSGLTAILQAKKLVSAEDVALLFEGMRHVLSSQAEQQAAAKLRDIVGMATKLYVAD